MSHIQLNMQLTRADFTLAVQLSLPNRGVSVLFGPSGSGKTTLLRCLAGLERAAQGTCIIDGEIWQQGQFFLPVHRRPLGYVFQEASLFPHLSVLENLHFGQKRSKTTRTFSLEQLIELLDIEFLLARKPDTLSGGERQRVAIARALATNPRLLLMDEPLAALDQKRKREILPFLERLHEQLEIPVIYVTHATDEVARLADHLVLMDAGKVLASGPLNELSSRLDLAARAEDDLGVVIHARLALVDTAWHLARVDFTGGSLWIRNQNIALGKLVRVHILAKDVSVTTCEPMATSIQNILTGVIDMVMDDTTIAAEGTNIGQGTTLIRLKVGAEFVLARITSRAVFELRLSVGQQVWLQIKSAVLMA